MTAAFRGLPNPFYVLLVLVSTGFVVTCLGYLISAMILQQAPAGQETARGTMVLADWLDRHGPTVLGVEFIMMSLLGVVAMVADPLFRPAPGRSGSGPGTPA
ncbi:hypothetical protein BH23PLA1_BH23PLA1_26870 [soil metagenome]